METDERMQEVFDEEKRVCKNCEFYFGQSEYNDTNCNNKVKFIDFSETELNEKTGEHERPQIPVDGLGYSDHDNYKARVWVMPEFGCIHWEPKKNKKA